jgi:hypothetical protein
VLTDLLWNKSENVPKLSKLIIDGVAARLKNLRDEVVDLLRLVESKGIRMVTVHGVCYVSGYDGAIERGWGMYGEIE